jgi:ABC-type transport system involved in multi-copper enzyme maturation permease subunit
MSAGQAGSIIQARAADAAGAPPPAGAREASSGPAQAAIAADLDDLLPPISSWALWRRQLAAVVRFELRKGFGGRRSIGLYLLALAPPLIFALRLLLPHTVSDPGDLGEAAHLMAEAYQGFIQRIIIFLGCVLIFGNLIRREVLDRSLHFYFLAPLRREVLVVAKYLTGLVVSLGIFGGSTLLTFFLVYLPYDGRLRNAFLLHGPGLSHLGSYLLVTALGCAGYGAAFLMLGFFFRSPALPALGLFGWEFIHFLLPPVLKQLSIIHYLQALCPVPVSEGPFALLSDAPAPWVSICGLLVLSVVLVTVAALRIRRMEISYIDD